MDLENFESVWRRVTASDGAFPAPEPPRDIEREEKLCVIKHSPKSCAVRFMAK